MRTVTRTYDIYNYCELSEEAKENVRAWYICDDDRAAEFESACNEELKNLFNNSDLRIQFSLAYCQGDGLNIYGELAFRDIFTVISNKSCCDEFFDIFRDTLTEHEIKVLEVYMTRCEEHIKIPRNCSRYSFCIADQISFAEEWIEELEYEHYKNIQAEAIYKLERLVISIFTFLAGMYEKHGYEYLYEVEEEEMNEVCEVNGWEFLADGSYFDITR